MPFGFDSKEIVAAIRKSTKEIVNSIKAGIKGAGGAAGVPFRGMVFPAEVKAETAMVLRAAATQKDKENIKKITEAEEKLHKKKSGYYKKAGEMIGTLFFDPMKGAMNVAKGIFSGISDTLNKKGWVKAERFFKNMSGFLGAILGPLGAFITFLEAMGVFQPIMDMLNAVLAMIGAGVMEELIPVFQEFGELLSDPKFQDNMKQIGKNIGKFLKDLLSMLFRLFSDPVFIKTVTDFITVIMNIATVLLKVFRPILTWLAGLNVAQLYAVMIGLFTGLAFLWGLLHGGPIVGAVLAGITAATMLGLLRLQEGGIVTRPTLAILGERGPEMVIPLNKAGPAMGAANNEEVLWATEDNGEKLDTLIQITAYSNRFNRRGAIR